MQSRDTNTEVKTINYSIYNEAKKIIEKFKIQGEEVKSKKELEDNPWREDEYREQCRRLCAARITREETGLSAEQFFAVSELIGASTFGIRNNEEIDCTLQQGEKVLELSTRYRLYIPGSLAPLGKVNFSDMQQELDRTIQVIHHPAWKSISEDEMSLQFEGKNVIQQMLNFKDKLSCLAKACKELDNDFSLNLNFLKKTNSITVSKTQLEKMRLILEVKPQSKPTLNSDAAVHALLSQHPVAKTVALKPVEDHKQESPADVKAAESQKEPKPDSEKEFTLDEPAGAPGGPSFF